MDDTPRLLEIGRVGRAHGLRGEVAVQLTTNVESRLAPGAELYAGERRLVVEGSRRHGGRWLVSFEGVSDRDGAEELRGLVLSATPAPDPDDPDALFVHEMVGAMVVDATGRHLGEVVEVIENPAADLLSLDGGALVPLTFVASLAAGTITLTADLPDGLVDG